MSVKLSEKKKNESVSGRQAYQLYLNPINMGHNLWQHRELIRQFTRREVQQRYRGSYLGLIWSFITPLSTLVVYTFVFSIIFDARWEGAPLEGPASFALAFFAGLVVYNVLSETILASSAVITGNPNYVKKVVFPLEILPINILGSALIHSLFGLAILFVGLLIFLWQIPWTVIFLPLMYLPLIFITLGLAWFVASLGVFVRDLNHFLGIVLQFFFFLTPIVYPPSAVPEQLKFLIFLNPLSFIINHVRRVVLFGQVPDWGEFVIIVITTFGVMLLGYAWFMTSKKTFADVI